MIAFIIGLLGSFLRGVGPDFIKLVIGKWNEVKKEHLESETGGVGKFDKVRLAANFMAPFINILLILSLIYFLEYVGILPPGTVNELLPYFIGGANQPELLQTNS